MAEILSLRPRDAREMTMVVARFGGSTLEEIGAEFGVTRERARQILHRAGVEKAMLADRPLFTSKNNAVPQVIFAREDAAAAKSAAIQSKIRARQRAARRELVVGLQALATTLGRSPTLSEFAVSLGIKPQSLACITQPFATRTCGSRKTAYEVRTQRLYRAARLVPSAVGGAGHICKVDWKTKRREAVTLLRRAAGIVGGKPTALDTERLFLNPAAKHGWALVLPFCRGGHRDTQKGVYRTASRRLYRAAGILKPYGWAPALDQTHGAY